MIDDDLKRSGWVGVDLDGTLAIHEFTSLNPTHIGPPVAKMVERVKSFLEDGYEVRIVTARVGNSSTGPERQAQRTAIKAWCIKHIGRALPVTCSKDYDMLELWDDRVVQIVRDTGVRADGKV